MCKEGLYVKKIWCEEVGPNLFDIGNGFPYTSPVSFIDGCSNFFNEFVILVEIR